MKTGFGNLIVVSPGSARVFKFRVTPDRLKWMTLAFLISMLSVLWFGQTFPEAVPASERLALERENSALKVHNRNVELRVQKVETEVSQLEEATRHITDLMSAE